MNKRKDMSLFSLWLTKAEEKSLNSTIEDYKQGIDNLSNISEIILKAKYRGDLKKR